MFYVWIVLCILHNNNIVWTVYVLRSMWIVLCIMCELYYVLCVHCIVYNV